MSTVTVDVSVTEGPRQVGRAPSRKAPEWLPGFAGIAATALLLPFRDVWVADVILVILAFTVPGVLALRALRVPSGAVESYPLYIPGAALGVMLVSGLAIDLLGPRLGISKPLAGATPAIADLALSLVLWLVGLRATGYARLKWRRLLDQPDLWAPLTIPAVAAAGALLLTNGSGPLAARLSAIFTAACVLACLLGARRLTRGQTAMLLFACALAAEWSFALRSQEVVGFDLATEINLAQHTQALGIWHAGGPHDAYGAMLSITLLPSVVSSLTGLSPLLLFKVVYPVFGALLVASTFLVADRFLPRAFAAGAAGLLLVQSYFFQQLPELARQEIALFFFALLLGALLDRRLPRAVQLRLVTFAALGLVVSHYSTTYIAIPAIVLAILITAVPSVALLLRRRRRALIPAASLICAAVVLIGGAAIWYGPVTHSTSNLGGFFKSLDQHGLDLLPNHGSNLISTYLGGNVVTSVSGPKFQSLAVKDYRSRSPYIHPLPASQQPRFDPRTATVPQPKVRAPAVVRGLSLFSTAVGELMLLFGGLGTLGVIILPRRRRDFHPLGALTLGFILFLTFIRFSGTASEAYNQTRALLQSLPLMAIPAAWAAQQLVNRFARLRRVLGLSLVGAITLLFAYDTGVTALITGGGTSLNLSQGGEDFEREYMTPAELAAAKWSTVESHGKLLYADRYGQLRLSAATGAVALTDLTPQTIDRFAWVYGTRTNTVLGRARGEVGSAIAVYRWPANFLNSYFDFVYANGDSRVYHR